MRRIALTCAAGAVALVAAGCQSTPAPAPLPQLNPPAQSLSSLPSDAAEIRHAAAWQTRATGAQAVADKSASPFRLVSLQPEQRPDAPIVGDVAWQTWARSVEGRPIELARFGNGPRQVLVVGGLYGDHPHSAALAESLARHLHSFPVRLSGTTVTIVRDANPDGRARTVRENARGVDLDRNFSSANWRKLPHEGRWLSGRLPESEPETKALADLIETLHPERVVVLLPAPQRPALVAAGPAADWIGVLALDTGLPRGALDPVESSGTLAAFAGLDRNISTAVLLLPTRGDRETVWTHFRRGLVRAVEIEKGVDDDTVAGNPQQSHTIERRIPAREVSGPRRLPPTGAVLRRPPREDLQRLPPAGRNGVQPLPPVLKADELTTSQLVPVVTPRARRANQGTTQPAESSTTERYRPPSARPPSILQQPVRGLPAVERALPSSPNAAGVSSHHGAVPSDGQATGENRIAPQAAPAGVSPEVRRLPPVTSTPKLDPRLPQKPIPYYPETGY